MRTLTKRLCVSTRPASRRRPAPCPRRTPLRCAIEENGTQKDDGFVEMRVAFEDFAPTTPNRPKIERLRVPDPKTQTPSRTPALPIHPSDAELRSEESGELIKAKTDGVLVERSLSTAEMQRRNRELAIANLTIQSKEKEIRELRQFVNEMQIRMEKMKSEQSHYRTTLHEKDCQLTEAYKSLIHAADERAELREALYSMETDLLNPSLPSTNDATQGEMEETSGDDVTDGEILESEDVSEELLSERLSRLNNLSHQLRTDAEEDQKRLTGIQPFIQYHTIKNALGIQKE